ncbi:MAG: ATP-dependent DNA ligase [Nitrososphaerales archaeon]
MAKTFLRDFAETCEAIKSTSSKLKKIDTLSKYLTSLDNESLPLVCRFLSGYIFTRWSSRRIQVGYSLLTDLALEISGVPKLRMRRFFLKHGDLGDVVGQIFSNRVLIPLIEKKLTIIDTYRTFEKIASLRGPGAVSEKRSLLKGLLLNSSLLEAKYLIKIMLGELRIGLVEGLVEESIAKAFGYSVDEVRDANLVLADIGLTAELAYRRGLEEAELELMHPTNFMLADTMADASEIAEYFSRTMFAEFKYDGIRAQAHKSGETVKIFSRRLEDVSRSFPEIIDALKNIKHDVILDGEVLPFKDGRPLPFQTLQHRLRRKFQDARLAEEVPVRFFVYDLLYIDGDITLRMPLTERRRLLGSLDLTEHIRPSHLAKVKTTAEIQKRFDESKESGYEGLVVKNPTSPYTPGRRKKYWVKLKKELDTLDVVVVAAEFGHGRRAGVLSDYTFAVRDEAEFKVVGKAYSGLTDAEIAEMTERLKAITFRDLGFKRLVYPRIVLEVAFDGIQRSDRHDSGFALRFPRIKRIRDDKVVEDIDTLAGVRERYMRQRAKHA